MGLIAEIHRDLEKGALQLLVEYRERLLHEAVKLCGDASQAEELVFRTIERVLQKSETYRSDDNLFGWMKTILTNLYRDDLKHPESRLARTVPPEELESLAGLDFSAEERILRNSDGEAVREALGRIDPEHRRLLQMRFYEEMTLEEIAAYLKCPVGTVWRRMQLALKFLSGKLNAGVRAGRPMAILAALMLAGSLFGAVSLGVVAAMKGLGALGTEGSLGSLESEGSLGAEGTLRSVESEWSLGSVADSIDSNPDPIVSNPDPIVPKDTIPAEQISTTENTNTEKEETMNLKSITKSAAKLAFGAALTTGFAANAAEVRGVENAGAAWVVQNSILSDPDTGWAFKIASYSRTVGETTYSGWKITDVSKAGTGPVDFRNKPLPEGGKLLAFVGTWGACMQGVTELYLPDGFLEFGAQTFQNNKTIRKIEPFLPSSVVAIGSQAFQGCSNLEGDLLLARASVPQYGFYNDPKIGSLTLGKSISSVGTEAFNYCTGVSNVTLLCESAMSLAKLCFGNFTGVRELKFAAKQGLSGNWSNVNISGLTADYIVKVRVLKTTLPSYSYTAWDEGTHRELYEANFPGDTETPIGVYALPMGSPAAGSVKAWLFTYEQDLGDMTKLTVSGKLSDEVPYPAYGTADYEPTAFPLTCTNSPYAEGLGEYAKKTGEMFECYAGVIETLVEDVWGSPVTNWGNSVSFTPPEPGVYRLTWLWRPAGYVMPKVVFPTIPIGVVMTNDVPSMGTWCRAGDVISYTASDADGTFVRWYGDVPAGQVSNRTVSIAVNRGDLSIEPFFLSPHWEFQPANRRLTDGNWIIQTKEGSVISDIVLGDGTNPGGVQGSYERRIDLTKPIKGGGVVTAFASYALKVSWDWPKDKSPLAIILPRSVTLLDYQSFMNEKSVTNIVFGSCPTISSAAFTDCGFGQMLWEVPWKSWRTFVEDRTKLIPWESCGATTQAVWRARFSGKVPAGLTVGFGGQWVRFLPNVGMKLIFK